MSAEPIAESAERQVAPAPAEFQTNADSDEEVLAPPLFVECCAAASGERTPDGPPDLLLICKPCRRLREAAAACRPFSQNIVCVLNGITCKGPAALLAAASAQETVCVRVACWRRGGASRHDPPQVEAQVKVLRRRPSHLFLSTCFKVAAQLF